MSKRSCSEPGESYQTAKRPFFPVPYQLADIYYLVDEGMVVRNNVAFLRSMDNLSVLFTRPTQMGKSTLFSLAEKVYSKTEKAPGISTGIIPDDERNARFVLRLCFLEISIARTTSPWQTDLARIDSALLEYIKRSVSRYLRRNPELQQFFTAPNDQVALAGDYLQSLSHAIEEYSTTNVRKEGFMVLVDEYDRPLRETLFHLFENSTKSAVAPHCPHYISFFNTCKSVGEVSGNMVWLTGVVPIALDLICEFKPKNMTFTKSMAEAVGLRDEDVDRMLEVVHSAEPFDSDVQKTLVREAIRDHANHLQFGTETSLYHTRIVNEIMNALLDRAERDSWMRDLSSLPAGVARERAPRAVYKLLRTSRVCREVAKDLVAKKDISGSLNKYLNLPDVATTNITKDNYLTLLVHLGIASAQESTTGTGHIFRLTSRYFRSEYLNELLGVTLGPLFDLSSVQNIYDHQIYLEEFLLTLPESGMSKMIQWAKTSTKNRILELQFQGFLVGELHDHFISEDNGDVLTTQQDVVDEKSRTDIQLWGKNTVLILELKQKPSETAPPTQAQLTQYHDELYRYVETVSKEEKKRMVAGFVVVMYANGTKFHVERTRYPTN